MSFWRNCKVRRPLDHDFISIEFKGGRPGIFFAFPDRTRGSNDGTVGSGLQACGPMAVVRSFDKYERLALVRSSQAKSVGSRRLHFRLALLKPKGRHGLHKNSLES